MKFIKLLLINLIAYSALFCTKEIGKYKMIDIDEYRKNLNHEEINQYHQKDLIIICDETGKIANFDGTEIVDGIYECEEAYELFKLMSFEDKQKTYLRKFNGSLQIWYIKD